MSDLISQTVDHVKAKFEGEGSGHDWWHIYRVWQMAKRIAKEEQADTEIVELAALLHDIADWKFHDGDDAKGAQVARDFLEELHAPVNIIDHVCQIISEVSYKGAGVKTPMSTIEGMCVQDADRLDAIGAIGIARTFAYGGHAGRLLHDPNVEPVLHQTKEAYKNSDNPSLNHFYEKLLLLKDRMNTKAGKKLAEGRHSFMEAYLEQFLAEWDGKR